MDKKVLDGIVFKDTKDLATCMLEDMNDINSACTIGALVKFDEALVLIKELLRISEDTYPYILDFEPMDLDGYDREYYVTVSSDGSVTCEKAFHNEYGYIKFYMAETIYVHGDCCSMCYINATCDNDGYGEGFVEFEFEYDLDDYLPFECCECCHFDEEWDA